MWEINVIMKRKDSNCVVTLSDQGEVENASNFSEYTINSKLDDLGHLDLSENSIT